MLDNSPTSPKLVREGTLDDLQGGAVKPGGGGILKGLGRLFQEPSRQGPFTVAGGGFFWIGVLKTPEGGYVITCTESIFDALKGKITTGSLTVERIHGWVWIVPEANKGWVSEESAKEAFLGLWGAK